MKTKIINLLGGVPSLLVTFGLTQRAAVLGRVLIIGLAVLAAAPGVEPVVDNRDSTGRSHNGGRHRRMRRNAGAISAQRRAFSPSSEYAIAAGTRLTQRIIHARS